MAHRTRLRRAALIMILTALTACGDGDGTGNPSGPSGPTVGSGSSPGPSGATITIGANGAVSPAQVSISTGQSVTLVNNHTAAHEIASDPHPAHTQCPSINALGNLPVGQTRLTNSFTGAGTCGFHDHSNPDSAALKGTITIR